LNRQPLGEHMQIIKLDATDSTNVFLKNLSVQKTLIDFTTVVAKHQVKGRGQRGSSWYSEEGKNLTFSVFKKVDSLDVGHQFGISMCTSLALYKCLKQYNIPGLFVKWPNDIMSGDKKVCGILIENTLSGGVIESSIIGIGLNVNQTTFEGLEKASSLQLISGQAFNLEELLANIVLVLKHQFNEFQKNGFDMLKEAYEDVLFRKDIPSTFEDSKNQRFTGIIRGVSKIGRLQIELEKGCTVNFDLKEVSLLN